MPVSFSALLTDCLTAMGDISAATWSRTTVIWPWCIQCMRSFPILRPMADDHTNGASAVYSISMPTDFREVISVEYPIGSQPPNYLERKNRLDPDFYNEDGFYDIDHDYSTGSGWILYFSGPVAALAHVKTQYLANHKEDLTDSTSSYISVPDEYEDIIVAYVLARGFRERLGFFMKDPTAHSTVIAQLTEMVLKSEERYDQMVLRAQQKLADSKITHGQHVDKFDRVY